MSRIPFTKMQTIGNDFVVLDLADIAGLELSELAVEFCTLHFGVGADGLLVVSERGGGDILLRMFNPDGSEDFCGNGIRCAAIYAVERGWAKGRFIVEQRGYDSHVEVTADGHVSSVLAPASFETQIVPMAGEGVGEEWLEKAVNGVVGTAVTTGSTHFIAWVDELPGDPEFLSKSPAIENSDLFPERTSIMWAHAVSDRRVDIRIWERGGGETLGCGTGACATAAAWFRKSGLSGSVEIASPGGVLVVEMDSWSGEIKASSKPEITFTGSIKR
jgi:diaminopimelate epimerase